MADTIISLLVAVAGFFCFFTGRNAAVSPRQAGPIEEPKTNEKPRRSFVSALLRALAAAAA